MKKFSLVKCTMKFEFFFFIFFSGIVAISTQDDTVDINQYCNSRSDCGSFGYICEKNRTCQCDKYYVPNKFKKKCVGGVGQICKYDEYCIEGAFCEHQTRCKCKDNYYPTEDGLVCSSSITFSVTHALLVIFSLYQIFHILLNG